MTRPRKTVQKGSARNSTAQKGSRGHAPKKMTAQGRGGATRETTRPVRDPQQGVERREGRPQEIRTERPGSTRGGNTKQGSGTGNSTGSSAGSSATPRRYGSAAGVSSQGGKRSGASGRGAGNGQGDSGLVRRAPPKIDRKKSLPELKRVQLDAPPADRVFVDRDGEKLTFPDSNLRRMAAQILSEKRKAWRYRPFNFPLFTDRGHEQAFHFDFYVYDAEDSVIRLILVVPYESREVWDRVGRFKRQYPMYSYELWTPEKLAQLAGPRGRLGF